MDEGQRGGPAISRFGAASSVWGICGGCTHARRVESARGSVFLRCALHEVDARFAKYPRLPLTACPGFRASNVTPEEDR